MADRSTVCRPGSLKELNAASTSALESGMRPIPRPRERSLGAVTVLVDTAGGLVVEEVVGKRPEPKVGALPDVGFAWSPWTGSGGVEDLEVK